MSEEIKPCPFCGLVPKTEEIGNDFTKTRSVKIKCRHCSVVMTHSARIHSMSWIREKAVSRWNQRPYDYDMPAIVKKVQRLEAAINQAITDCIPLLSWIDDDDTAVEMVEHLSEILGGALCKQPE